jgi:hypothetical protein
MEFAREQGCQIFLGAKYQNGGKYTLKIYTKIPQNIPNCIKIYQIDEN